ncbi:MAG: branched-chain amino acid aminotransferase [Bdellovibrionota bacterium]
MPKWNIPHTANKNVKAQPASSALGFGKFFTDHMFVARYSRERGWYGTEVVPYAPLAMDPGASVLHYGQALFEGLKAFRQSDGSISVFRPEFNWKRMTFGAGRLCMEAPPLDLWMEGLDALLKVEQAWVPKEKGTALYIRPTLIGTESFLGVRPSNEYLFFIILSPVGAYYSEGTKPVKIWVEKGFVRAAPGGLGETKAAANYAGSLKAAQNAKEKGYAQVLWLDVTKTHIEEVGTMNVFFDFGDEVVTPALDGTILEGGTRQVVIELLREQGRKVSERKLSLSEILGAHKEGRLKEAFGTGTAAVISPIGELSSEDFKIVFKPAEGTEWGPTATQLYKRITDIHYGIAPDTHGWLTPIKG